MDGVTRTVLEITKGEKIMLADNKPMTDKEVDAHAAVVNEIIKILVDTADKLNFDRDSYIKSTLEQMQFMAEISTFENFEADE